MAFASSSGAQLAVVNAGVARTRRYISDFGGLANFPKNKINDAREFYEIKIKYAKG